MDGCGAWLNAGSSDAVHILVGLAGGREDPGELRSPVDEVRMALSSGPLRPGSRQLGGCVPVHVVEAGGGIRRPPRQRHWWSHQAHDGFPVAAWVIDQRRSRAAES